ncbi:hypothetical protein MPSEU_000697400 [Mayamaea pseudoterrestris]|nr:hypothetical protein MPSEU_000697400 [Mayamaea pseudoterrestris]
MTSVLDVFVPFDWRSTFFSSNDEHDWIMQRVPSLPKSLPKLLEFDDFRNMQQASNAAAAVSSDQSSLFSSLYKYCFETSSTALGDLTTPTSCLVLLILILLLRLVKRILLPLFRNIGVRAAKQTHGTDWIRDNPIRIHKFGEYVFRLLYHSLISCYGVWAFSKKKWWLQSGTRSLFQGFPYHAIEPRMAWYYLLQSAYNLDALVSLLEISFVFKWKQKQQQKPKQWSLLPFSIEWSPTVRGDFQEMFVHHVVTNLLVMGSSFCRLTRIGSMVFLVHDLSDIPVDCSKLANFVKYKKTTIGCFVMMVLVWIATRLYALPFIVFRAALTESHHVIDQGLSPLIYICYRHFFYSLLAFLILLHVTWFGMFLRIFYTMVHKNEVHDYSEHKAGETNPDPSAMQRNGKRHKE